LVIAQPNQVWAADITYLPIGRGFLYLVAVMDWASRAVLSWRLSNTMDSSFCVVRVRVSDHEMDLERQPRDSTE
jgi:putative transposase